MAGLQKCLSVSEFVKHANEEGLALGMESNDGCVDSGDKFYIDDNLVMDPASNQQILHALRFFGLDSIPASSNSTKENTVDIGTNKILEIIKKNKPSDLELATKYALCLKELSIPDVAIAATLETEFVLSAIPSVEAMRFIKLYEFNEIMKTAEEEKNPQQLNEIKEHTLKKLDELKQIAGLGVVKPIWVLFVGLPEMRVKALDDLIRFYENGEKVYLSDQPAVYKSLKENWLGYSLFSFRLHPKSTFKNNSELVKLIDDGFKVIYTQDFPLDDATIEKLSK